MNFDEPAGSSDPLDLPENERVRAICDPRCASLKNGTSRRQAGLYDEIAEIDLRSKMYHRAPPPPGRPTPKLVTAGRRERIDARRCEQASPARRPAP
jgi:hypothetical protein